MTSQRPICKTPCWLPAILATCLLVLTGITHADTRSDGTGNHHEA